MPKRPSPRRKRHLPGFSLLELLIVIVIIGVLTGVIFVGFGAIRRSQDARNTKAALEIARSMFGAFVTSARGGGNAVTADNAGASSQFYLRLAPPQWDFNADAYSPNAAPMPVDYDTLRTSNVPLARTIDYYNVPRRGGDVPTGAPVPMDVPLARSGESGAWSSQWQVRATMLAIRRMRSSPDAKNMWSTLRESQIQHVGALNSGEDYIIDAWGHPLLFVPGSGLRGVQFGEGPTARNGYVQPVTGPIEAQGIRSPDGRAFWVSAGPDGFYDTHDDNIYSFNN